MLKVSAIVRLPRYGANYDGAHDLMASFMEKHQGKLSKGDLIAISFRESQSASESFLFGLAECVRAHDGFEWSIQHSSMPEEPKKLMELVPGLKMLDKGCIPYVQREVEPFSDFKP